MEKREMFTSQIWKTTLLSNMASVCQEIVQERTSLEKPVKIFPMIFWGNMAGDES